jgi:hypothetical protein
MLPCLHFPAIRVGSRYLESVTGQSLSNTGNGLVSASTSHNDSQGSSGSIVVPRSDLNARCVADGVVERVCGSGSHTPTGGGGGLGAALRKASNKGRPGEHVGGICEVRGGGAGGGVVVVGGGNWGEPATEIWWLTEKSGNAVNDSTNAEV